jgi:hypothetical protein
MLTYWLRALMPKSGLADSKDSPEELKLPGEAVNKWGKARAGHGGRLSDD